MSISAVWNLSGLFWAFYGNPFKTNCINVTASLSQQMCSMNGPGHGAQSSIKFFGCFFFPHFGQKCLIFIMWILVSPDGFWEINANTIGGGGGRSWIKVAVLLQDHYLHIQSFCSSSLISQCKLYLIPLFSSKMTATKLYRLNNLSGLSLIVYVLYVRLIFRRGRQ